MKKLCIYLLFILGMAPGVDGRTTFVHRIMPDHVRIQFAGNLGVFSAGFGYSFISDNIQADFFYGFVPKSIGGNDIHTIAIKSNFRLFKFLEKEKLSLNNYLGFSVNYTVTENTFLFPPGHMPDNYYYPNALHFAPMTSLHLNYSNEDFRPFEKIGIYLEIGTLDKYLYCFFKTGSVNFLELWNLAAGITFSIK